MMVITLSTVGEEIRGLLSRYGEVEVINKEVLKDFFNSGEFVVNDMVSNSWTQAEKEELATLKLRTPIGEFLYKAYGKHWHDYHGIDFVSNEGYKIELIGSQSNVPEALINYVNQIASENLNLPGDMIIEDGDYVYLYVRVVRDSRSFYSYNQEYHDEYVIEEIENLEEVARIPVRIEKSYYSYEHDSGSSYLEDVVIVLRKSGPYKIVIRNN
jgi:hypothetical protein